MKPGCKSENSLVVLANRKPETSDGLFFSMGEKTDGPLKEFRAGELLNLGVIYQEQKIWLDMMT